MRTDLFHCLNPFTQGQSRLSQGQVHHLEQRLNLISSKLSQGNIKKGMKLAASDDKIEPFLIPNYKKLVFKHPKGADINAPNPENIDSFFVAEFEV